MTPPYRPNFFFSSSSFNNVSLLPSRLFFFLLLHRGPTVARGLFMRPRDSEGKHKELPTRAYRAVSSALTPEGCVWAAPRHSGPAASDPGPSLSTSLPPRLPPSRVDLSLSSQLQIGRATANNGGVRKCLKSLSRAKCWRAHKKKTHMRCAADEQWGWSSSLTSCWVQCWKISPGS